MGAYLSHTLGCPCSLSEQAAVAALQMDGRYEESLRAVFRERRDRLYEALQEKDLWTIQKSKGAFYLWLDISRLDDDITFCRKLLDLKGVALTPGSAFCCPGYVRLAYTKDISVLLEAATRMKKFIAEHYSSSSGVNC